MMPSAHNPTHRSTVSVTLLLVLYSTTVILTLTLQRASGGPKTDVLHSRIQQNVYQEQQDTTKRYGHDTHQTQATLAPALAFGQPPTADTRIPTAIPLSHPR